jgi:hypothetical protein
MTRSILALIVMFMSFSSFASRDERANGLRFSLPSVTGSGGGASSSDQQWQCKLSAGALCGMASLYGSLDAAKVSEPAPSGGAASCGVEPPRSASVKSVSGKCASRKPAYSQADPRMSASAGKISFGNNDTDCSGLVTGNLCRAGANLKPGQNDCKPATTAEMIDWGKGSDCFEQVQAPFQNGDIFVSRGNGKGHTFQVCHAPAEGASSPSELSVCESASTKTGVVVRTLDKTSMGSSIAGLAVKKGFSGKSKNQIVLRHVGSKKSGCVNASPPKFENEDCLGSCSSISPEAKL